MNMEQISNYLSNLSSEESALVGAIFGSIITGVISILVFVSIFFLILSIIINWKIIKKTGEPGWKSLIPFYRDFVLWGKVWDGKIYIFFIIIDIIANCLEKYIFAKIPLLNNANVNKLTEEQAIEAFTQLFTTYLIPALIMIILSIITLILSLKYVRRYSKAFGHSKLFALGLFFIPLLFELIIAFDNSKYLGNQSDTFKKK